MLRIETAFALVCLALAANPASAQAADTAASVRALAALEGADYVQARDELLAGGSLTLEALAALSSNSAWTGEGWREAAVAAALGVRLTNPELAARIDHMRGLDPAHYGLRRVPQPEVGRELAHLSMTPERRDVAALVIETHSFLRDVYAYSTTGRAAEMRALSEGLLAALERIADPRGLPLAREVAADSQVVTADRIAATLSIGAMAGRSLADTPSFDPTSLVAELNELAGDETAHLRHAAAQALGKIPGQEALDSLRSSLAKEADSEVRATILTSIGLFAAPMVWHAHGEGLAERAEGLRAQAATFLATYFAATDSEVERVAARGAVLMARHAAALDQLDAEVPDQALLIDSLTRSLARTR